MECEIRLEKIFEDKKNSKTGVYPIKGKVEFILGTAMQFFKNKGKLIEDEEYMSEMDKITEDFLDKTVKERIEWLYVVFKNKLRFKLNYIKYIDGNKTYTYRGQKMFEM